jgi:membrane associated rhomboid family serine protease
VLLCYIQKASEIFLSSPSAGTFESFVLNDVPQNLRGSFDALMNAWNANPESINYKNNAIAIVDELMQYKVSIPTVGASGAVFGVLLAFGMLFPDSMIYVFFFLPLKAKYFVILYGLFELYSGLQNNPGDNVAHFAHLGGMLFGFLLIKYWKRKNKGMI